MSTPVLSLSRIPHFRRIFILWSLLTACSLQAAVSANPLFDNNMVLQRGMPIPVYGTGTAGESVSVALSGPDANGSVSGLVGEDGRWLVYLPEQTASSKSHTLTVNGKAYSNVLIGDVWICAGQSNMEGSLKNEATFDKSSLQGLPIRLMRLKVWNNDEKWKLEKLNPNEPDYGPQETREIFAKWTAINPTDNNTLGFSTAGIVLAREIQKATGVPVGLIQNAMGGTAIEAWTPREYFNYPLGEKIREDYYYWRSQWSGSSTDKNGKPQDEPAILYNSLMAPLTQFGMRGIYWWQGEHNTSSWSYDLKSPGNYRIVLPIFIQAMRDKFVHAQSKPLPFLITQLHPYGYATKPGQSGTADVRAGQYEAYRTMPMIGLGVSHDIPAGGGDKEIHPNNREAYAMRAVAYAVGEWYGHGSGYQPSGYIACAINGNSAVISFTPGLALSTDDGQAPREFVIVDKNNLFKAATATITGPTEVTVTATGINGIKEIRYAFADLPKTNLVNSNGLPVSPFRSIGEVLPPAASPAWTGTVGVILEPANPAEVSVEFMLPSPLRSDMVYVFEQSLNAADWTELARRPGQGIWSGSAARHIREQLVSEGFLRVRAPGTAGLYRLRMELAL